MPETGRDCVVISGLSCRLPQSDNVHEFRDNLMNGVDMVTEDNSRWEPGIHGLPRRRGTIRDISKFDASFFGVHPTQANRMDPQLRMLLEVCFEAIIDAGHDPSQLRGTNTGVFIGASSSESHHLWSRDPGSTQGYTMTGCNRAMLANRLSFYFDFKGPSYTMDTACSSSLLALHQAVKNIENGNCDDAIVGGAHLCLDPSASVQFLKLGMLSPDGKCRSFDENGQGYVRSEGIVALYLQKKPNAKRKYCTVLNSKTNSDGNKEQGITFPSGECQKELLLNVYNEISLDPTNVSYVEAHGTGTKAGDLQEVNTICEVFCRDRSEPLKIGSVKSNIGHAEPASGLAAVVKVIIAMESEKIPGNLHFDNPNPNIPGLTDGRLKVIDQPTAWKPGIVGVNSFGFGGSNVHTILQANNESPRSDSARLEKRLFVYSSRTAEGVQHALETVSQAPADIHLHALLNETAHVSQSWHPYRGFTVLNGSGKHFCQKTDHEHRPVWYVFAGMGTQWGGMARDMMVIDTFRSSIMKSTEALKHLDIDLHDILMSGDSKTYEKPTNAFVAIAAIQVALVDILKELGISPDGIVGHSVGELGCAYADGCLTAEETVLAAYWRGHCIESTNLPKGAMAAIGLTWGETKETCPPGIVPACHNAKDTVTISGPVDAVHAFVSDLKAKDIFAREVNSSGVAFHSHYMSAVAPGLRGALSKVIPLPKPRSNKWISSSIPKSQWDTELARYSSAEYHVNNLVSPVLFQEALQHVPDNALVIEIAPHCLLQAILKRSLSSECCIVGLMNRKETDNVEHFLTTLRKCFQHGLNLNPLKLVQSVDFPVQQGTPMISHLVKWDHSQSWDVPAPGSSDSHSSISRGGYSYKIDLTPGTEDEYLAGHKIDDRVLFPATGYLLLVWKALAEMENMHFDEMCVQFEDINLLRATVLPLKGTVTFDVRVMPVTGDFQITESGSVTTTGRVTRLDETEITQSESPPEIETLASLDLSSQDVYKLFRLRGYQYGKDFQGIVKSDMAARHAVFRWADNWVTFSDYLLQMVLLSIPGDTIQLPTRIRSMIIDPIKHKKALESAVDMLIPATLHNSTCVAGGITINGPRTSTIPRRDNKYPVIVERYKFIPYIQKEPVAVSEELHHYYEACNALAIRYKGKETNGVSRLNGNGVIAHNNGTTISNHNTMNGTTSVSEGNGKMSYLSFLEKCMSSKGIDNNAEIDFHPGLADKRNFENSDCLLNVLTQSEYLKLCLDIVVENTQTPNLCVLEVVETGLKPPIEQLVSKYPLLPLSYTIAKHGNGEQQEGNDLQQRGILRWSPMERVPMAMESFHLTILNNILHDQENINTSIKNVIDTLDFDGFLLVHERTHNLHLLRPIDDIQEHTGLCTDLDQRSSGVYCTTTTWREVFSKHGLEIIFERRDPFLSTIFLLRRANHLFDVKNQHIVEVSGEDFCWVEETKRRLHDLSDRPEGEHLWLLTNNPTSGVVGMVNCLRKEPGSSRVRCIMTDNREDADPMTVLAKEGRKDLVMNVYKCGRHGSHKQLSLTQDDPMLTDHAFVDILNSGDLSSLEWVQSNLLNPTTDSELAFNVSSMLCCFKQKQSTLTKLCSVHYASLNFRDIMLATGNLSPDVIPKSFVKGSCKLGTEFSGIDNRGHAVMGLMPAKALATCIEIPDEFLWSVPLTWSLEEAATVPMVYSTAYYALVVRGNIQAGDSVLIHSGSGGVGQAAIAVALHYNCTVYTTVGSQEKREYLMKKFPHLNPQHFYSSRDTTFEHGIMEATGGRGVDVVLNSLADEKLQASIRVLAQHGKFLEIGKVDLSKNSSLGMGIFLKNISFHGILLDALFEKNSKDFQKVSQLLNEGIKLGVVRPLKTKVFDRSEIEQAFRYMAKGTHIGKIVIKIKDKDGTDGPQKVLALPRASFSPDKCYIIAGGLGGFGLELAHWIADRGAQYIILTTRSGVKTGYQAHKLKILQDLGVDVYISKLNIVKQDEINRLAKETGGKAIGGIFNLAAVLSDGVFENQTVESFQAVCGPKIDGTANLDRFSRQFCKETCDWFVAFSSFVNGGYGNVGQSNYGYANSVVEKICELRKEDGLPGLAIQWGAIADVGIMLDTLGDNVRSVAGTKPQSILSCLSSLDRLFSQSEPVVSCYTTAEKETIGNQSAKKDGNSVVQTVCQLLGFNDLDSINQDAHFSDLGLDSLMGVEVKQTLERSFDICMSMKEIRHLTVNNLRKIANDKGRRRSRKYSVKRLDVTQALIDELIPDKIIVRLNDVNSDDVPLYFIHPLDGTTRSVSAAAAKIKVPVFGVQCTRDVPLTSVKDIASYYLEAIYKHNSHPSFHLAAYSIGASIAIEITHQADFQHATKSSSENPQDIASLATQTDSTKHQPRVESLILMEGSHKSVAVFTSVYHDPLNITSLENTNGDSTIEPDPSGFNSMKYNIVKSVQRSIPTATIDDINNFVQSYNQKLLDCAASYTIDRSLNRDVVLIKAENGIGELVTLNNDFGLSEVFIGDVQVHTVPGNHITFRTDGNEANVADIINKTVKEYKLLGTSVKQDSEDIDIDTRL